MSRYLLEQARKLVSAPQRTPPAPEQPRSGRATWRSWAFALAAIFVTYIYLGPFFVKDEYQWSVIRGKVTGKGDAATILETVSAKASEAAAVATAHEEAKVTPAVKIAEGAEVAKIGPQIEIATKVASIDVMKAAQIAEIEIRKQAAINTLEAAKVAQVKAAEIYRDCLSRAQSSADQASTRGDSKYGTLAGTDAARMISLARAQEACEPLKPQEDAAIGAAQALAPKASQ